MCIGSPFYYYLYVFVSVIANLIVNVLINNAIFCIKDLISQPVM